VTTVSIAKRADAHIAKGKLGVYFAWGAFSKRDGQTFTDSHGDQIPDDEMIAGALSLAKSAQLGHEHDGTITGSVPLVMPMTEDVQAALELTSPHAGLVVGFTPTAEVAKSIDASIAAGEPWQMSIEGLALAEAVAKSAEPGDVAKAEHKRTLRNLTINKIDLVKRGAHGAGTAVVLAKRKSTAPPVEVINDAATAAKWLKKAIARHERHMNGTESTSDTSQQKLMDEIRAALGELDVSAVDMAKRAPAMTAPTNGHQHLIWDVEEADGGTSYEVMPGSEYGHSHPFVRLADGSISIGEAAGHTHTVSTEEATMADDINKQLLAAQADVTKAEQRTAAVLALPVEQFAFAKRLVGGELAAYLAKSATERAEAAKPVHVAKSGEVFYSSDDARLVSMAKAHDAMAEQVELAKAATATAEIAKAAAALPNVKGADLIAKAIHGGALTADERKSALADLAAVNASIALITQPIGKGGAPGPSSALEAYDAGLAAFAKSAGKSPDAVADDFLETPEGSRLYDAYAAEQAARR